MAHKIAPTTTEVTTTTAVTVWGLLMRFASIRGTSVTAMRIGVATNFPSVGRLSGVVPEIVSPATRGYVTCSQAPE